MEIINNGYNILSIDAKDIYIANHYLHSDHATGYNIRYTAGENKGHINTRRFINTLDKSLDLFKICEVYRKVYRNTNMTFQQNGHTYTRHVINVTFKYSNKEFNHIGKNTYVAFGYRINDLDFQDGVCIMNGKLAGIQTHQTVTAPISKDLLGKAFYYENKMYHPGTIKTINTAHDLRTQLYQDGFICDGIKYVRYKRSGGSARAGKCLFIDERLYKKLMAWAMCGLKIKTGQNVDLAGLEAYLALPLSSIIDTLEILPKNFLIIDDYESIFLESVVETRLDGEWLATDEQEVEIRNSIWDGQSLLDVSMFEKYPDRSMLLLRNKFFKSACFNCNIQKFFRDNGINKVSQLNGFTLAHDIKDIKIITTKSSVKYLKYGSELAWFKNIDHQFGIVKHEKETPFFNGRMVQIHYQLLNTLQLSQAEIRTLLKPSLDYLYLLKNEPAAVRYHIKYPADKEFNPTPLTQKNDIVYHLLGINEDFAATKLYNDFKNDLTKAYGRKLRHGHLLVNGNYSTLLGNPLEMLMHAIGSFTGASVLGTGNIHSHRFPDKQLLLGSRSPHVTIGNVWLCTNVASKEIDQYFNLSKEIVCINSIGESVLDRLSGADFDSDTVLLTDNQLLIDAAGKNYHHFKVPVNHVTAIKKKRFYTNLEKADLDIKTSDNKIGDIINLAQELNSLLWHRLNNGADFKNVRELYYDICQLDVMSGIEIDKAKKEFAINTYKEMQKIKAKWINKDENNRFIKPYFFGHLAKAKGYYDNQNKNYYKHDTAMDYLQIEIDRFQRSRSYSTGKKGCKKFSEILDKEGYNPKSVNYRQIRRVIELAELYTVHIKRIYADESLDKKTKYLLANREKQECAESIGNIRFNKNTMLCLLQLLEDSQYQKISRLIMNILFGYPNTPFFTVIKDSQEHIPILMEIADGDIKIFDFTFKKIFVG